MSKALSIESVPGHPDFCPLRDIAGILVDLRYEIRATNSIHNLVFPFYLTGS